MGFFESENVHGLGALYPKPSIIRSAGHVIFDLGCRIFRAVGPGMVTTVTLLKQPYSLERLPTQLLHDDSVPVSVLSYICLTIGDACAFWLDVV